MLSTSSLCLLALSKRGCTPTSSTFTLLSESFSSVHGFRSLRRCKGCCRERNSNYPREQISTQSNRWCKIKISYFCLLSSREDGSGAGRISEIVCSIVGHPTDQCFECPSRQVLGQEGAAGVPATNLSELGGVIFFEIDQYSLSASVRVHGFPEDRSQSKLRFSGWEKTALCGNPRGDRLG